MVLIDVLEAYAAVGAIVAVAFLAFGIERTAPSAKGAYAFRPLLLPGLVLLWPVVLVRWYLLTRAVPQVSLGRHYRVTHRWVWRGLAILLPALLLASLALRQEPALDPAPELLTGPAQ